MLSALPFAGEFPPRLTVSPFGRMSYNIRPSPLAFGKESALRGLTFIHDLAAGFNGQTKDRLAFHRRVFVDLQHVSGIHWVLLLSFDKIFPMSFKARPSPVCRRHRSSVDPKDTCFPLLLKRPCGELDQSVFVGRPCCHGRDVHPLCLLLRCVAVATGGHDLQS